MIVYFPRLENFMLKHAIDGMVLLWVCRKVEVDGDYLTY